MRMSEPFPQQEMKSVKKNIPKSFHNSAKNGPRYQIIKGELMQYMTGGKNSRAEDEGEKRGRIEIAVIVARCAASAPWQDVMLCLMRQQCRQLVPDMTLSVTNK